MIRALLISAIIGAAAYHYGVEAGKKEARAELSQSLSATHLHHKHRKTAGIEEEAPADSDAPHADNGMDGAAANEAQLLEHRAANAVTTTLKEQAASTMHHAVKYVEKKLKGDPPDRQWAPEEQPSGH